MKPRDQKPDKDFMVQYENYKFPCTDSETVKKLLWDRRIQNNERATKSNSRVFEPAT
jgi:hypothetical protein